MKKFIKFNQGKLKFRLLPIQPLQDMVAVLTAGAQKYPANNWLKCKSWMEYYDAMQRHAMDFAGGEIYDKDLTKRCGRPISHVIAIAVNAVFLAQFVKTHSEYDDRLTLATILRIKKEAKHHGAKKTRVLHRRQHGRSKRKNRTKRTN